MKIGRNDPCPCNSGNKYKKCCAAKDDAAQAAEFAAQSAARAPTADGEAKPESGATNASARRMAPPAKPKSRTPAANPVRRRAI